VPMDVWLVRLRIAVVTDVHTAMRSPAAVGANWVKTHALAAVPMTSRFSGRALTIECWPFILAVRSNRLFDGAAVISASG